VQHLLTGGHHVCSGWFTGLFLPDGRWPKPSLVHLSAGLLCQQCVHTLRGSDAQRQNGSPAHDGLASPLALCAQGPGHWADYVLPGLQGPHPLLAPEPRCPGQNSLVAAQACVCPCHLNVRCHCTPQQLLLMTFWTGCTPDVFQQHVPFHAGPRDLHSPSTAGLCSAFPLGWRHPGAAPSKNLLRSGKSLAMCQGYKCFGVFAGPPPRCRTCVIHYSFIRLLRRISTTNRTRMMLVIRVPCCVICSPWITHLAS